MVFRLFLFFSIAALVGCSDASHQEYSGAVHQLTLNENSQAAYNEILMPLGLEFGRKYRASEYYDITKAKDIGIAGHYDFLLLSTGGTHWDHEASLRFSQAECAWETTYYSNHDMTVIHETCRSEDGEKAQVRILKAALGRDEKLHQH